MREIKFRAWNKDCKEMVQMAELLLINKFDKVLKTEDKNHIIMQFTGLVDNNGKEIYEGDIVKTTIGHKFEIGFIDGKFGCADGGYLMTFGNEKAVVDSCEVIGNIYENKELAYKGCGVTEEGTDNYIKD